MRSFLVVAALASPAVADEPEPTHEGVALALSAGATALSWGLVAVSASDMSGDTADTLTSIGLLGTLLAPSAGHWYSDDFLSHGFKARLLGAGSAGVGAAMIIGNCIGEHAECDGAGVAGGALLFAGFALYGYGTVHDIVTAPRAARRHNASITVAPAANGLAIAGSF